MSALHSLNPKAEEAKRGEALDINIGAAEAISQVLAPNFGPSGLCKLLVGGAGDLRMSKDGAVLLDELPIAHPSAALISRTATAMDDVCGDGTTECVLLIGDLLRQSRRWLYEGVHPRVICAGYELAKERALQYLERTKLEYLDDVQDLHKAAASALATKLKPQLAAQLSDICVKAVLTANKTAQEKHLIDLSMIEVMTMQHQTDMDSELINGIVMDHGWRFEELKCSKFENCFILTLNVTLEYEKSEMNSQYFYKSAEERVKQADVERSYIDERVKKIIELKNQVCTSGESFVVLNMKGVDQISLQMLASNGIMALRRVKRRNLERLVLACGGQCLNTLDNLSEETLGYAGSVYEKQLGEEKFTFVEDVKLQKSCTILLKAPNKHTILMLKDAIRDGLRAVKNMIVDRYYVPGAGGFEAGLHLDLNEFAESVEGKQRLGVIAFSDAILQMPKIIAKNSGFDAEDCVLKLVDANRSGKCCGLNVKTGNPEEYETLEICDGYRVKYELLHSATTIACQMLLVDEILKAGRALSGGAEAEPDIE